MNLFRIAAGRCAPLAVLTLLALGSAAEAASPALGEAAPDLGGSNWVLNAPQEESIAKLKGEVVFVERWGVKCPPCVALIPHVEKLQQTYGARGLHIFTIESQNHTADEVRAKISERGGKTYPVSAGGANNYRGDGSIPVAWLIGVDGKVIWQGNPAAETSKLDSLIEAEVAKVRFPGLGKQDFDEAVLKAVKSYMKQELGKAREEAQKVQSDEGSSAQAKQDAEFLLTKVEELAARQWQLVEQYRGEGKVLEAYETLRWFATAFKKAPEGERAEDAIKEFKKDKELKKELKAAVDLEKLLAKLEGQPAEVRKAALAKFAENKKVEGTAAARRAASIE